jgi:hypothetical protein
VIEHRQESVFDEASAKGQKAAAMRSVFAEVNYLVLLLQNILIHRHLFSTSHLLASLHGSGKQLHRIRQITLSTERHI